MSGPAQEIPGFGFHVPGMISAPRQQPGIELTPVDDRTPATKAAGQSGRRKLSSIDKVCIQRVLAATTDRCRLFSLRPGAEEIISQLAIRSVVISRTTSAEECRAFRRYCAEVTARREIAREQGVFLFPEDALPLSSNVHEWMADLCWQDLIRLEQFLSNWPPTEMIAFGRKLLPEMLSRLALAGDASGELEGTVLLTGVKCATVGGTAHARPKVHWQPITGAMIDQIDHRLSRLRLRGAAARVANDLGVDRNLARLLLRAAWLTGMRSVEMFRCSLHAVEVLPGFSAEPTDVLAALENANPSGSPGIRQVPVAVTLAAKPDGTLGGEVANYVFVLTISTAKTACSSPGLKFPVRNQILNGLPHVDLMLLHDVAGLRRLELSPECISAASRCCSNAIRRVGRELFPDRSDPITLHTLRHAFIDHAKLTMPTAEIAALTGHTARTTVTGYGRGYARQLRGLSPDRWMPVPDPERAARIESVWAAKKLNPKPSLIPETGPDPLRGLEAELPGLTGEV